MRLKNNFFFCLVYQMSRSSAKSSWPCSCVITYCMLFSGKLKNTGYLLKMAALNANSKMFFDVCTYGINGHVRESSWLQVH